MGETINEALERLAGDFEVLGEWEDRYRYILDLGRELEPLAEADRTEANKVRGCASQVWLVRDAAPDGGKDGRLRFRGDSDAHLVRGLVAILLQLYSARTPQEVIAFDAKAAFSRLGLEGALTSQRANGLFSMVERIRNDAKAAAAAGV